MWEQESVSGCGLVQKTNTPRSLRTAGLEGEGRRLPGGGDISADTMGEGLGSPNVPSAETWRQETYSGVRPSRHITSWGAEGERGGRRGQITEDIDAREGA